MTRSNAREVAVHLIYEIDYTGEDPAQAIETRMDRSYYSGLSAENDVYAERPSKKQMDYIRTCVTGVCEHAEELDALIAQYAVRWNLHRISRLTKAAMRLAIYEMRYVDDVPNGVAINECVELTRKYEDAQVVSFVNGILGSVARGKLFIHIIPIGARAVEELAELFAVIDDEAVKPGLRQLGAQKVDAAGCRSDGHFKPLLHVHPSINTNHFSLFYRIPPGITSEIFLRLFHFREKRV